jgi:hypothetical protein
MEKIAKTIYIKKDLIEEIGEGNFSERVNDLIVKGLVYEKNGDKATFRSSVEYLLQYYNKHNPSKPIN